MDAIPTYCSLANIMLLLLGAGEIEMLINGPLGIVEVFDITLPHFLEILFKARLGGIPADTHLFDQILAGRGVPL